MATAPKKITQFQAAAIETTEATVPGGKTWIVTNILVANTSAGPVTLSLSFVPSGGAASDANRIMPGGEIPAKAFLSFDLAAVMDAGDFISAIAGAAASISVYISGVEQT